MIDLKAFHILYVFGFICIFPWGSINKNSRGEPQLCSLICSLLTMNVWIKPVSLNQTISPYLNSYVLKGRWTLLVGIRFLVILQFEGLCIKTITMQRKNFIALIISHSNGPQTLLSNFSLYNLEGWIEWNGTINKEGELLWYHLLLLCEKECGLDSNFKTLF